MQCLMRLQKISIEDYGKAIFSANAPSEMRIKQYDSMMKALGLRQVIYGQCESLIIDSFPSAGSMMFAFNFYVHRALGNTNKDNLDDVLVGKSDVDESNVDDFPDLTDAVKSVLAITNMLKDLNFEKEIKPLKRML